MNVHIITEVSNGEVLGSYAVNTKRKAEKIANRIIAELHTELDLSGTPNTIDLSGWTGSMVFNIPVGGGVHISYQIVELK